MKTVDGKWVLECIDPSDPRRIKSIDELRDYIESVGFLPFFNVGIEGFSLEGLTSADCWWTGNISEDPWMWREVIAREGEIAYGKLFRGKAGFISKKWFPIFAAYRRDGYDFDSRYEDGLASRKQKKIIDILSEYDMLPLYELKKLAGFGKGGDTNFEGAITELQMQTYVVIKGFRRRKSKKNEEYGWPVADFMLSEKLFGTEHVRSAYSLKPGEAKEMILNHLLKLYPDADIRTAEKIVG
ncbi:MAG: hypothetical protein GX059_05380 [Clostridiales bacterium]|jgi:hypothetical protein|nr:hypothetical protein [Clostridiales bacterium]